MGVGRGGGWGGGSSERCLKWGGGGSLRDLSKNILKQGRVKVKVVHRGRGVLKVSPPLPPSDNFNCTLSNMGYNKPHYIKPISVSIECSI